MTTLRNHASKGCLIGAMLAMALVAGARPASAQERPAGETGRAEEAEVERRNEVALVVAGTRDTGEDATFFTLGLEFERRIAPRWAIVAEVEYLFDADRWVVVAPVVLRPARGVKLFAGPGLERADEEEAHGETRRVTHGLIRMGAGYTAEIAERYAIGPLLSIDFVREEGEWATAVVFGVSVGISF